MLFHIQEQMKLGVIGIKSFLSVYDVPQWENSVLFIHLF